MKANAPPARGGAGTANPDTPTSLALIVALTLVRVYFSLVVMSYARLVLQRFIDLSSDVEQGGKNSSTNPFAVGSPLGQGFRGKLGRALVMLGRDYWLGRKEDEEWTKAVSSKFRTVSRRSTSEAGPSSSQ